MTRGKPNQTPYLLAALNAPEDRRGRGEDRPLYNDAVSDIGSSSEIGELVFSGYKG